MRGSSMVFQARTGPEPTMPASHAANAKPRFVISRAEVCTLTKHALQCSGNHPTCARCERSGIECTYEGRPRTRPLKHSFTSASLESQPLFDPYQPALQQPMSGGMQPDGNNTNILRFSPTVVGTPPLYMPSHQTYGIPPHLRPVGEMTPTHPLNQESLHPSYDPDSAYMYQHPVPHLQNDVDGGYHSHPSYFENIWREVPLDDTPDMHMQPPSDASSQGRPTLCPPQHHIVPSVNHSSRSISHLNVERHSNSWDTMHAYHLSTDESVYHENSLPKLQSSPSKSSRIHCSAAAIEPLSNASPICHRRENPTFKGEIDAPTVRARSKTPNSSPRILTPVNRNCIPGVVSPNPAAPIHDAYPPECFIQKATDPVVTLPPFVTLTASAIYARRKSAQRTLGRRHGRPLRRNGADLVNNDRSYENDGSQLHSSFQSGDHSMNALGLHFLKSPYDERESRLQLLIYLAKLSYSCYSSLTS